MLNYGPLEPNYVMLFFPYLFQLGIVVSKYLFVYPAPIDNTIKINSLIGALFLLEYQTTNNFHIEQPFFGQYFLDIISFKNTKCKKNCYKDKCYFVQ